MNRAQIEERFSSLRVQRDSGTLDEAAFRVEVAKLLLRSEDGALWLIHADSGEWLCNQGSGWIKEAPPTGAEPGPVPHGPRQEAPSRLTLWLAGGFAAVLLLAAAAVIVLRLGLLDTWFPRDGGPDQAPAISVSIASPVDGSQVAIGQGFAIESTLSGSPDLRSVDRVELSINGQTLDSQAIQSRVQPGDNSLPLSQPWRPTATGEHQVSVVARSSSGEEVAAATITVRVIEASGSAQPAPACIADAVLIRDVTIPPDTVFPPDTRLEKVWQVRNSGTCAWGVGYSLILIEGDGLQNAVPAPVPPTAAGETAEIAVAFQAPLEPGHYATQWRLQGPTGELFGVALSLSIRVEVQVKESPQPLSPGNLQAALTEDGRAIRLTWEDRSSNESGFRIYRADVEASISLVAADTTEYVDANVVCGDTYVYTIVAFTASNRSEPTETASVAMPACTPSGTPAATPVETATPPLNLTPTIQPVVTPSLLPSPTPLAILSDQPPTLTLTVSPTVILAGEVFTITFVADDDRALDRVLVWGIETGEPGLDTGRFFPCAAIPCLGDWRVTGTHGISDTWTLAALAVDASGQTSEPAQITVTIRLRE